MKCALCFDEAALVATSWPVGSAHKVMMCAECRRFVVRRERMQKKRTLPDVSPPRQLRARRKNFPLEERIASELVKATGLPRQDVLEALREGRKPEEIRNAFRRG